MTISGGSALSKEDIDRMVKDAEAHAEEDRRRREEAETRNSAEQLVYSTEKFLTDNADKLPEDGVTKVRGTITDLRTALEGEDIDAVRKAQEALATASQELGSALYSQTEGSGDAGSAGGSAGASAGTSAGAQDDVVDAEVVDEDETR